MKALERPNGERPRLTKFGLIYLKRTDLSAITRPCEWTTSSVGLLICNKDGIVGVERKCKCWTNTSLSILVPGLENVHTGDKIIFPLFSTKIWFPTTCSRFESITDKNNFPESEAWKKNNQSLTLEVLNLMDGVSYQVFSSWFWLNSGTFIVVNQQYRPCVIIAKVKKYLYCFFASKLWKFLYLGWWRSIALMSCICKVLVDIIFPLIGLKRRSSGSPFISLP